MRGGRQLYTPTTLLMPGDASILLASYWGNWIYYFAVDLLYTQRKYFSVGLIILWILSLRHLVAPLVTQQDVHTISHEPITRKSVALKYLNWIYTPHHLQKVNGHAYPTYTSTCPVFAGHIRSMSSPNRKEIHYFQVKGWMKWCVSGRTCPPLPDPNVRVTTLWPAHRSEAETNL